MTTVLSKKIGFRTVEEEDTTSDDDADFNDECRNDIPSSDASTTVSPGNDDGTTLLCDTWILQHEREKKQERDAILKQQLVSFFLTQCERKKNGAMEELLDDWLAADESQIVDDSNETDSFELFAEKQKCNLYGKRSSLDGGSSTDDSSTVSSKSDHFDSNSVVFVWEENDPQQRPVSPDITQQKRNQENTQRMVACVDDFIQTDDDSSAPRTTTRSPYTTQKKIAQQKPQRMTACVDDYIPAECSTTMTTTHCSDDDDNNNETISWWNINHNSRGVPREIICMD
jgi:hypothetical protein